MAQVITVSTGDAWATNAQPSIATNSGPQAPTLVVARAYYDALRVVIAKTIKCLTIATIFPDPGKRPDIVL